MYRVRTSSGTFLARGQDKVIRGIEKRIADFTFIPVGMFPSLVENPSWACGYGLIFNLEWCCTEQGEGIQILHYEVGQKYEAHTDYFHDNFNTRNGGQRIATLLMYL